MCYVIQLLVTVNTNNEKSIYTSKYIQRTHVKNLHSLGAINEPVSNVHLVAFVLHGLGPGYNACPVYISTG